MLRYFVLGILLFIFNIVILQSFNLDYYFGIFNYVINYINRLTI